MEMSKINFSIFASLVAVNSTGDTPQVWTKLRKPVSDPFAHLVDSCGHRAGLCDEGLSETLVQKCALTRPSIRLALRAIKSDEVGDDRQSDGTDRAIKPGSVVQLCAKYSPHEILEFGGHENMATGSPQQLRASLRLNGANHERIGENPC